jgi:lipopolysaccharide/colanic/teichoic acid biosynthesis glycosyltransferase
MLTNLDEVDIETARAILQFRRPTQDAAPQAPRRFYYTLRRLLDFTIALALTLMALPIVALAALAVKLTSRGPAFYTQTRIGRGGRTFTIYKIRTMIDKCESLTGPRWTIPGDPRVTPLGWLLRRTHIDELPQLLNVLGGQMSLIGPRPERPEFVRELAQAIPDYDRRHAVLPGITGLAQVQLAPDTDLESVRRKLVFDLYQIDHMSFWLDARIMLATALHLLGISFRRLRRLRIVPNLERSEPAPLNLPEARPQQMAA